MFFPECVIIDESSSDRPVECTVVLGVQQTSIRERTGKLFSGIRLDSTVFITSYRGDIVGIFGRPRFHIHRSEGHGHITLELEMVEEIPPYTQIRLESLCCSLGSSIFYFVKYIIVIIILLNSIVQINEYERGIKFSFGKFSKVMQPGWNIVIPILQSYKKVDIRTKAVDVPEQEAITKDNVSIKINAVIYFKVFDASKAILAVENFMYAVSQLAQTTMRNAVGAVSLDELLGERDKISTEICSIIDQATDPWGIEVENVELKDIALPEEMKRVIATVAEAEREKDAIITKAKGELEAANNLAEAAETLSKTPGALHLRTLSTLNAISADQSNTIIFAIPIEILNAIKGFGNMNNDSEDKIKKL